MNTSMLTIDPPNNITCSGNRTDSSMASRKGSKSGTEMDTAWAQLISKARSRVGLMGTLIPLSRVFWRQRKSEQRIKINNQTTSSKHYLLVQPHVIRLAAQVLLYVKLVSSRFEIVSMV